MHTAWQSVTITLHPNCTLANIPRDYARCNNSLWDVTSFPSENVQLLTRTIHTRQTSSAARNSFTDWWPPLTWWRCSIRCLHHIIIILITIVIITSSSLMISACAFCNCLLNYNFIVAVVLIITVNRHDDSDTFSVKLCNHQLHLDMPDDSWRLSFTINTFTVIIITITTLVTNPHISGDCDWQIQCTYFTERFISSLVSWWPVTANRQATRAGPWLSRCHQLWTGRWSWSGLSPTVAGCCRRSLHRLPVWHGTCVSTTITSNILGMILPWVTLRRRAVVTAAGCWSLLVSSISLPWTVTRSVRHSSIAFGRLSSRHYNHRQNSNPLPVLLSSHICKCYQYQHSSLDAKKINN